MSKTALGRHKNNHLAAKAARLDARRTQQLGEQLWIVGEALLGLSASATLALDQALRSPSTPVAVKVQAARAALLHTTRFYSLIMSDQRIAELERRLEEAQTRQHDVPPMPVAFDAFDMEDG